MLYIISGHSINNILLIRYILISHHGSDKKYIRHQPLLSSNISGTYLMAPNHVLDNGTPTLSTDTNFIQKVGLKEKKQ